MAKRTLIIQTAFVGDLLLTIPLIRRAKAVFSNPIDIVCRKGLGDFLLMNGLVDEVIEVDKSDSQSWKDAEKLVLSREYSHLICAHRSFRSALLSKKVKAEKKVGYHEWWNFWAFERTPRPMHLPEVLRLLALIKSEDSEIEATVSGYIDDEKWREEKSSSISRMSKKFAIPAWASMTLPVPSREQLAARLKSDIKFYNSMEKVFSVAKENRLFEKKTVFVAAGSVWATKRWTAEGYQCLGQTLVKRGYNVCFIGAADEKEYTAQIAAEVPGSVNICGETSLFETYQLFLKGTALICNDSGAMHLAAVAGLPTVAIFGPTTLDLGYRPWQEKAIVVGSEVDCRPCGSHGGAKCPKGTHECMTSVNELQVIDALNGLLAN